MNNNHYKTRVLPFNELQKGMTLAESIYTHGQMMLIPAGRVIDDEILETLNWFSAQRQIGRRVAVVNSLSQAYKMSA